MQMKIIVLITTVCIMYMNIHSMTHLELRGHHSGGGSLFLPLHTFWQWSSGTYICVKHLHPLNHIAGPLIYSFLKTTQIENINLYLLNDNIVTVPPNVNKTVPTFRVSTWHFFSSLSLFVCIVCTCVQMHACMYVGG